MRMHNFLLAMLVATGIGASGCQPKPEGAIKVVVIGGEAKLRDPNLEPLSNPDTMLLANVAQGLVRFDASGQIEAGLAERWIVSDDGLSYIFRIATTKWSDGSKVTARQVARLLQRAVAANSQNTLKDTLGAVEEIVPMTDRVIEFRLRAPRPNLLQLLAQPELAIISNGRGTGPFALSAKRGADGDLRLERQRAELDGETDGPEEVWLSAAGTDPAVKAFVAGRVDLILGGTFADLPLARAQRLPRGALVFDPVAGLFGLQPLRKDGPLADPEVRALLSQAIDRGALVAQLGVPGLLPRATILQGGLEGVPEPVAPAWLNLPIADRRAALIAESDRLFGVDEKPSLRIALPEGAGADLLLRQLQRDWGLLGIKVERASPGQPIDLKFIDAVAPSASPAWFLRQLRCEVSAICADAADPLIEAARAAPIAPQRGALLNQAAQIMDEQVLFIALTAPIRWSLVSDRVRGFSGNRFARHTLTALQDTPGRD
ncbi:MAG: ABC transporter substrate-binding protein [Sphingomicrobium sp.]